MKAIQNVVFFGFGESVQFAANTNAGIFNEMSQKRYLSVSNFDTHLHYKDKNPIWIKLYCSILDDYEFAQIPDENKFHAVGLMLLASRLNNKFPDDERWLRQKINANSEINLKLLLEIGFLEVIKGTRTDTKKTFNGSKHNKIKGEISSAVLKDSENPSSAEQNRTEEKRKDENTTEQNTRAETDAKNNVLCVDFKNSFQESSEENNQSKGNGNGGQNKSQFSIKECLKYVEICKSKGDEIKNVRALANHIFKSGESDAFILATLYPQKQDEIDRTIYGEPRQFTDEPCRVCFGAKMADTDGKGFKPCEHCRNERGKATGWQPLGENENE